MARQIRRSRRNTNMTAESHKRYTDLLASLQSRLQTLETEREELQREYPGQPQKWTVYTLRVGKSGAAGESVRSLEVPVEDEITVITKRIEEVERIVASAVIVPREQAEEEAPIPEGWRPPSAAEIASRQREQQAALRRTAGRPLELKIDKEQDIEVRLQSKGLVMFTIPDPPRFAERQSVYCGNPIDGVAYFLATTSKPVAIPAYVKVRDLELFLNPSSAPLDQIPKDAADLIQTIRANMQNQAGPEGLLRLRTWFQQVYLGTLAKKRGVNVQVKKIDPRGQIRRRGKDALPEDIQVPTGRKVGGTRFMEEEPAPYTEEEHRPWRKGDEAEEKAPQGAFTLPDWSLVEVTGRKFNLDPYKPEGVKLIFRKLVEAGAMERLPGGELRFPQIYFIVWSRKALGYEVLQRFAPYARRDLVMPDLLRMLEHRPQLRAQVQKFGFLATAISIASEKTLARISPETAYALLESRGVRIAYELVRGAHDPQFAQVDSGKKITLTLPTKAKNPFFSWVRDIAPLGAEGLIIAACIPPEKDQLRRELSTLRGVLGRLRSAFGRVQSLFRKLSEGGVGVFRIEGDSPETDTQMAVTQLSRAFAGLLRWWGRIDKRADEGDSVAVETRKVFLGSDLSPEDTSTPFARAFLNFSSSSSLLALISTEHEWVVHKVYKRKAAIEPAVQKLLRRGFEVEVDEATGTVHKRLPYAKAHAALVDDDRQPSRALYLDYMQRLMTEVMSLPSTDEDGEAVYAARRPGRSALQFFAPVSKQAEMEALEALRKRFAAQTGLVSTIPHPMDDVFLFIESSLHSERRAQLLDLRKKGDSGIPLLRTARPVAKGDPSAAWRYFVQKSPEVDMAAEYGLLTGQYSLGGLQISPHLFAPSQKPDVCAKCGRSPLAVIHRPDATPNTRMDPLDDRYTFELLSPPGWGDVPIARQVDVNWVLQFVVSDIFLSLVWRRGVSPDVAARESRDLILLAYLYDLMGGHELVGGLNPVGPPAPSLIDAVARDLGAQEVDILGGKRGIGSTDRYAVYKTYNPVLFELTRLFWPSIRKLGSGGHDPDWQGLQGHWSELLRVDDVGRYGFVAQLTQKATVAAADEDEVKAFLVGELDPSSETENERMLNRDGSYTDFLLNWPLGQSFGGAEAQAESWVNSPLSYTKELKQKAELAVGNVLQVRMRGLLRAGGKRSIHPAVSSYPTPMLRLDKQQPPILEQSVISLDPRREQQLLAQELELDKLITEVREKLKARMNSRRR